jgi:hypothetical protein
MRAREQAKNLTASLASQAGHVENQPQGKLNHKNQFNI